VLDQPLTARRAKLQRLLRGAPSQIAVCPQTSDQDVALGWLCDLGSQLTGAATNVSPAGLSYMVSRPYLLAALAVAARFGIKASVWGGRAAPDRQLALRVWVPMTFSRASDSAAEEPRGAL
jgi:hypothetical protein